MKLIPVKMKCPIDTSEQIVYCYVSTNGVVISNGCNVMSDVDKCALCMKRSVELVKPLVLPSQKP
jgi:hypothetical protein